MAAGLLGVCLACAALSPARALDNPRLDGIRPLGMGNAFLAVCDDRNALYTNPAGLSRIGGLGISGLGFLGGVDAEFLSLADFIRNNSDRLSGDTPVDNEFHESLAPYDDRWVSVDANAYTDVTMRGFGAGVFTTGSVSVRIDRGVYEPRVYAEVSDDLVAVVGAALPGKWHGFTAGATAKGIWRRNSSRALRATELADFDAAEIASELESSANGFGMDFGLLWNQPRSRVSAAAVLRDAVGVVGGEAIGASLDFGLAYRPLRGSLGIVRDIVLAADFRDAMRTEVAPGNRLDLGAELKIPFVSFRGGVHQGYPTAGIGVHAFIFSLDYAFAGRELGTHPGADGQYMHYLEMRIGG
jgi:hypothetical protein